MDRAEQIRAYFRAFIAVYFMICFGCVLFKYVGTADGLIKPEVIYSWLTGLIMGFIAFYFAGEAIKK